MTHFRDYTPEKYSSPDFEKVEEGIYQTKDPYGIVKRCWMNICCSPPISTRR